MKKLRVAIIGAGPIGLEAALYAIAAGCEVTVYEAGSVAESVRRWESVRLFSPWALDTSPLGLAVLDQSGLPRPAPGDFPTGREFRDTYLLPIARRLGDRVVLDSRVTALARDALLKSEAIGTESRRHEAFRLLIEPRDRSPFTAKAEVVIDASGVYENAAALGASGIPAPGERELADRIDRHIPDLLHRDRPRYRGTRVLLVGSGYSAATALIELDQLLRIGELASLTWLRRTVRTPPLDVIDNDPLPARARLSRTANEWAAAPPRNGASLAGASVESLLEASGALEVTLTNGQQVVCDRILSLVGYRPDLALTRELQVHHCYASEGPMKLAAALLGENAGDCLTERELGPDTLRHPEPGFFTVGAKSYGRRSDFLLRTGREQVRDVFRLLSGRSDLDLWKTEGNAAPRL